jgi:ribosomal protein S18 acetylase RimI-like enzyme
VTSIRPAAFPADIAIVRTLFTEYATWLNVDLSFQGFSDELEALPGKYARPAGGIVLALAGASVVGCAAFRPLEPATCEVKRLWVRPEGRMQGVGRALMERVESDARSAGYEAAVLDTLEHMTAALTLYESLGYERIAPYYNNPLPGAVYLGKHLVVSSTLQK